MGQDSLLLSLLQLMVPALLVLQQHPSVLQVPGEVVTLPLQLVSHLLGLFIRTLQLPELWKEESKRVAGAHPPRHRFRGQQPCMERNAGRERTSEESSCQLQEAASLSSTLLGGNVW